MKKTRKIIINKMHKTKIIRKHLARKDSQVFSLDFIFACIIFVVIMIASVGVWHSLSDKILYVRSVRDLSTASYIAMSKIVDSEGLPVDWNSNSSVNISKVSPGIMDEETGFIDHAKAIKLLQLTNSTYNDVKNSLGLSFPGYDFTIDIDGNISGVSSNQSSIVFGIDRFMSYSNGTIVQIKLRVSK